MLRTRGSTSSLVGTMDTLLFRLRLAELMCMAAAIAAILIGVSGIQLAHSSVPLLVLALAEAVICYRHPELAKQAPSSQFEALLASSSPHSMPQCTARRSLHIAIVIGVILGVYVLLLLAGQIPPPWRQGAV